MIERLYEGRTAWAPAVPGEKGQPHPRGKPGLWVKSTPPQYEVFAPAGRVLTATGTHSAMAWSAKEARELEGSTEPCLARDCDLCEPGADGR